ncbi:MAG: DUF4381 family protein [Rickettsiales bacterium]|jgi:hypothetical protein|nr:DUF4381 family protein [Rickettsiales bacterium]
MKNNQLEKIISDIYDLKEISIFPLSNITYLILFASILLIIISILLRKHYLEKRPWLKELKIIKNDLQLKTEINLDELSQYLKKIAMLKYHHNYLNKMSFPDLIHFLSINEKESEFHIVLDDYSNNIYNQQNIIIKGSEYNNILRLLTKWI